jgi:hypothetical protein
VLHLTNNFGQGSDQTIPINGTAYSFTMAAGSKSCIQIQTVNQYGNSAWFPSPIYCFNDAGQQVS